ncbi:aspartate transaminase aat1 [Clydaea vesicula]|uniref:Aspartate aminotransferase n=1 Tax=Clydaea vesicula TaxID=447962 RepID=A0AAD5XZ43_9FUNG|nr:aspartate transaminase aat1 [Clydaea vesicula]
MFSLTKPGLRSISKASSLRFASTWNSVPAGGVTEAFNKDTNPLKMSLGVGAYRDDKGKPYVLNCVKKAEKIVFEQNLNKEYLPITGLAEFQKLSAELAFGKDSGPLNAGQIVTCQSLSGTGALRIGGQFLSRFFPGTKKIYVPNPTWGNHHAIFKDSGLETGLYRYFDKKTNGLDISGMIEDLKSFPAGSIILLHACAHNPTGVDPTPDQWADISSVCKSKGHFIFFDMAYQGFASGDATRDAFALRHFVERDGHQVMLAQSFAKNLGLYGERIGNFSLITDSASEAARVASQVKIVVRPMYSNPPSTGARIVKEILSNEQLRSEWHTEVAGMAKRIHAMRSALRNGLAQHGSKHNWEHITSQIGMFCYTGISPEQVGRLAKEFSIYLTKDGRISIAGINPGNVDYLAKSLHEVTK